MNCWSDIQVHPHASTQNSFAMDFLRIQLISGEEVTLSADDFVNLVERPGFLSVTALKQPPSWADQ